MDQVFIKDLRIRCIIGVEDWERKTPQDILVSVEMSTEARRAAQADNIADCVNYDRVAQKIRRLAEGAGRFTVEALAEDIARLCLAEPGVLKVRVRVEKPEAVRDAASAGVEIER